MAADGKIYGLITIAQSQGRLMNIEKIESVSAWLKTLRREAGLSQDELAASSNVSQQTISKLENNNDVTPRRKTMIAIAKTFMDSGIKPEDIDGLFRAAGLGAALYGGEYDQADENLCGPKDARREVWHGLRAMQAQDAQQYAIQKHLGLPGSGTKEKPGRLSITDKVSGCIHLLVEIKNEDPRLLDIVRLNLDILQDRLEPQAKD